MSLLFSADIEVAVLDYVELLRELTDAEMKYLDFMSVMSSVLFLSDLQVEAKIDVIFSYIALGKTTEFHQSFSFEDFLVALSSFESGLSFAMGKKACSEAFIKELAKYWGGLMNAPTKIPSGRGSTLASSSAQETEIQYERFFELCTNRQQQVRRLLDIIASAQYATVESSDRQEAVYSEKAQGKMAVTGGDEWLANPAWKKTAEKMVPTPLIENTSAPTPTLSLEWVHGYRAFDCHNNLRYGDTSGDHILFPTAALTVAQSIYQESTTMQRQAYFGDHTDDVLSLAVFRSAGSTGCLLASGEIGKVPAIHLYRWDADPSDVNSPGKFTVCLIL